MTDIPNPIRPSSTSLLVLTASLLASCSAYDGAQEEEASTVAQAVTAPTPANRSPVGLTHQQIVAKANLQGTARVIVHLSTPVAAEATLTETAREDQRQRMKGQQASLVSRLGLQRLKNLRQFEYSPLVAFEADAATIAALASSPEVALVQEDTLAYPVLEHSVPQIEAPPLINAGDDGFGQTIAILDTGVDAGHPDLAGKVVSEACYSSNLCPGGVPSSTDPGSGAPCTGVDSCSHGTMVSGVAAGVNGVAKRSSLIAVQVFSRIDDSFSCNGAPPCLGAYESNVIAGLERVYSLRNTHSIAAVNLSMGDGAKHTTHCDFDARKPIIDNLRAANIATVIASGNSAQVNGSFVLGIAGPSCISSSVSVGSVNDSSASEPLDQPSSWSQAAPILSLLAPGNAIDVPVPGGGHLPGVAGTSLAAPHVAGAWALMKSRRRDASVDSVLTQFRLNGTVVGDFRGSPETYTPRVALGSVVEAMPNLALNGAVTSSGNTCDTSSEGPERAVNGVGYDKWCAHGANQWLRVDLGAERRLRAFTIKHAEAGGEDASYNSRDFNIEVSRDGTTWFRPVNVTGNSAPITTHVTSVPHVARYVRLNVVNPGTNPLAAARIYELQVFGDPGTNLALNKTTTSSQTCASSETGDKAVNGTANGFADKWCSNVESRWLRVDLGNNALIDRVVVKHAGAYRNEVEGYNTLDYDIEASLNGTSWTTVSSVRGNTSLLRTSLFAPTTARYVRLTVLNGGIDNVARIYELEVYGSENLARGKTATGTTNCSSTQTPAKAVDGSVAGTDNKWCSVLGNPNQYWWRADLGTTQQLTRIVLRHAGVRESASLNSKNFTIQTSTNNTTWTTVATVTNNTSSVTNHVFNATSARYVRVNITAPTSSADTRARLYEVEAYR
jgi:hypothetical protein